MREIASNFSLLFFDKISKFIIVLVSTTLVSRYLGPEDFGRLSYAIAVSSFLTFAIQQGLEQLIIRHLAQIKSAVEQSQFIGAMISYKIIFGIAGFFIYWIFSGVTPHSLIFYSLIAAVFNSADVLEHWLFAHSKMKAIVLARQSVLISSLLIKLLVIWQHGSVETFAKILIFDGAMTVFFWAVAFLKSQGPKPVLSIPQGFFSFIKSGSPLIFSSLCVISYSRIDQMILGSAVSNKELGYYAAASKILDYINILPMIFSSALLPLLLKDSMLVSETIKKSGIYLYVSWIITGILFGLAPLAVQLIYGDQYSASADILRVLSLSIPVIFFSVLRQTYFTANGLLTVGLRFEVLVAAISIMLNFILTPRYGALGAAWAWTLTAYASNLLAGLLLVPVRQSLLDYCFALSDVFQRQSRQS